MLAYFIRRITTEDQQFLWEMLYHALYVSPGCEPLPRDIVNQPEIARYVSGWGKEGDLGFAAIESTGMQPIGAAWIRLFREGNKGFGYVDENIPELSIALLPEYRDRGIGSDLLFHLIEEARKRYSAMSLSVSAKNPAVRLYERMGFEIIERAGTALTMKKTFEPLDSHPSLEGFNAKDN